MKTFETEKNNIPEGATHYQDQDGDHLFAWFKLNGEDLSVNVPDQGVSDAWFDCSVSYFRGKIKPIPQAKEVEWVNGDKCIYNDEEFTFVSYMCKPEEDHVVIWRSFDGIEVVYKTQISKPEKPEAKKERERDESAKEIMIDLCGDKVFEDRDWEYHKKFTHSAKMAFKLVDLGYRKGSE